MQFSDLRCVRTFLLALFLVAAGGASAATPLSGTKSIGPTGDYSKIGAAVADIQANGLAGPLVLELQAAYVSTVETFPLLLSNLGATAANTVTLRPQAGATALSISSANGSTTVDLTGAQFLTIDGRPGGVGTVSQLIIANTNTSSSTLRFVNEASNNTILYVTFQGVNTSSARGVIYFSNTTGANGNDNNTVDHCNIGDGATMPVFGIYSHGTTTAPAQNNSGNTISNCNIFNFSRGSGISPAGVLLDVGNTDWTITGNNFYETAGMAGSVQAINVNNPSGNNFTITGNVIGGSAPGAGGAAWTLTGTPSSTRFAGIQLNVGNITPSSVQGNTIQNIAWTTTDFSSSPPGGLTGIYILAGAVNVGTVTGNTIGGATGTGSISVAVSLNGNAFIFGVASTSTDTVTIANNTIGSITTSGATSANSASINGIQVKSGTNIITGNTIGSTSTANSLNATNAGTSLNGQEVVGILSYSTAGATITGNTVANLINNYAGTSTSGECRGIVTAEGVNAIVGNTVHNLSTASLNDDATFFSSVTGIAQYSSVAGQTVSQNTVHSLANTSASGNVAVIGIYYEGAAGGTNVIARNLVHSLAVSSTSVTSGVYGMKFEAGNFIVQNNMVRVGIDAGGVSTGGASIVRGIFDMSLSGSRNFCHNSIYVGGTQTSGSAGSAALVTQGLGNARAIQNNIFVNARGNSAGAGKHYAINYTNSILAPGLAAGGNIFFASGAGGVLGQYSGDRATLSAWQLATGQDFTSAAIDPLFINATGDATAVDLHLQPSNPAEGGGIPIASITDDIDGQSRAALTPVDIGADAGNFTTTGDVFAPLVIYTPLSSGSTANRTVTNFAVITDNAGVAGGANAPRLYFKKSTDADVFGVPNNSTGNGWKYVSASNASSPFGFTIDYTLLNGGGVSPGNTIQYFVVAQDAANNFGTSPFGGYSAAANPPVQNVNAHGSVNTYSILGPSISGTKTVGNGGNYVNLTGANGIFAAINSSVVTGDLVIKIISDLTEDGTNGLNALNLNDPAITFSVTIQPSNGAMKTISGTSTNGLIRLNGADRVTIDGRFGGAGRFLTFRNTNTGTSAGTIMLSNDASNNIVRNCIVEGATTSATLGVIGIGSGSVTGNCNNLITANQVRDLSTAAGVPLTLIGSVGGTIPNSNNTISNNELFNFNANGISVTGNGNDSWTISGNTIYEAATATGSVAGIQVGTIGNTVVAGNFIHDLVTTGASSSGIVFVGPSATIARNRITCFSVNAATTSVYGIKAAGNIGSTVNVLNNQITLVPATAVASTLYGLCDQCPQVCAVNVYYNSIVIGGTASGNNNSWASLHNNWSSHVAQNNIYFNLRTGGAGTHFAAGHEFSQNTYSANFNVYAGTGATPASFMDFSTTSGTPVPVTFAAWQTSVGGDTNSQAGNPGGNFSSSMFVNAGTGDLHLAAPNNPLVSQAGTPVNGVTTDYDNEIRPATMPDIGSDQFYVNTAPTLTLPASPLIAEATGPAGAAVSFTVTANDAEEGALIPTVAPPGGGTFALGDTTVNVSVSDSHGATTTGSFVVRVVDTTRPALILPANITAEATGANGAAVTFRVSANDLVSGVLTPLVAPASGSNFPIGTTTVNVSATDAANNTQTGSFTVTVQDTTKPVLHLPANITAEATDANGAIVTFNVSANDAVDGAVTPMIDHPSGSAFPLGTTTVHVSAIDIAGNLQTGSFTVMVQDTTKPVLTLPANITVEATSPAGAVVMYDVSASDAVDGAIVPMAVPASGGTFAIGVTTVTVSATDAANNTQTGSFTVTVTAPQLQFASSIVYSPIPAVVSQSITFSAGVNTEKPVTITWNFGDGSLDQTGASVSHTFAMPMDVTVTVSATDGFSTIMETLLVHITPPPLTTPIVFQIASGALKFDFVKHHDSLTLAGNIPLRPQFPPMGKMISVTIGGYSRVFVLDAKGRGGDANNKFTLVGALKSGAFKASSAKIQILLKNQNLFAPFQQLGFQNATVSPAKAIALPIDVNIEGADYIDKPVFNYTAKSGKTGTGKAIKR